MDFANFFSAAGRGPTSGVRLTRQDEPGTRKEGQGGKNMSDPGFHCFSCAAARHLIVFKVVP